jgi:hypothetical protein
MSRRNSQRPRHHRLPQAAEGELERGLPGGVRASRPLGVVEILWIFAQQAYGNYKEPPICQAVQKLWICCEYLCAENHLRGGGIARQSRKYCAAKRSI